MPDLRQALKDFVATSNSGTYQDEATLLSKFPELQGYDINTLKDFVATSNSGSYQTEEELFQKFPEFSVSTEKLKKKGPGTMEQMVPQNTTESFIQESSLASQEKPQVKQQPKQKPGILAQPAVQNTTESFLAATSAEPSIQPTKVVKPKVAEKPKEEEKSGYLKTLYDNLALGASYANESIFSLPETVINVLSIPQNYIAEKTGWNIGSNADILKEQLGIKNPILDWVQENQKVLNGEVAKNISDRYTDGGIVSNFSSGNYQDGFELLGASIAQSVPISLSFMLGGAYTTPAKLAAISTLALTENQRQELEEMDPNMSESEKTMKALAMSGAESLFSSLGTGTIGKVYRDIAKREGTEAAKGILKDGLVQTYKRALEKSGAVAGFVGEGIEEAATTITQNVISGKPAFEGAADAFATGAGSGVVFTAPISAINAKKYIENKVEVYDTKDKIGQILKDKSDNIDKLYNVPVASEITAQQLEVASLPKSRDILVTNLKKSVAKGDITEDDAKQSLFVFDKIQQVSSSLNDLNVGIEDKAKIASLLKQRDELKTKTQNKDEVLVVEEKQQIEGINNQIQLIISKGKEDAVQEQSTNAEMLPSEQPELGLREVGEGNTGPTKPAGQSTEVISDEKSQEIGTQVGDLVNTLSEAMAPNTEGTPNERSIKTRKSNKAYKKLENFFGYDLKDPNNENQIVAGALYKIKQMLDPQGQGYTRGGNTYQFADVNDLMTEYKSEKSQGTQSEVVKSIDTLLGITPEVAPQVAPQENQTQIETLRAQEQTELMEAIPNAAQYVVDGKVDRTKITDANELKLFDEIYDKYDKLITPLLQTTEVSSETQITPTQQNEQAPSTTPTSGPVAGNRLFNNPLTAVSDIAKRYYKRVFKQDKPEYFGSRQFDEARAKRISDAFIAMKHEPNNPQVKKAYEAMAKETLEQYKAFLEAGYRIEINNKEPYANSQEVIDDLRNRKRIKIFSTESGFGDNPITPKQRKENPLLKDSGFKDVNGQPLLINDAFRAVHDFFGHAELGNSFGFKGEENAWNVHSRMFSPLARRAMTTETRGQNSYVNFSGVNQEVDAMREQARKLRAEGKEAEAQAIAEQIYELGSFADQKIGLLPEEFSEIDVNDIGDVNLQPQGLQSRDVEVAPATEKAPVEEVTVEEEEQYEPITIKDIDHDTFTRDNSSDYEEDERDGDNGRTYIYLSSITVPIVNQDGDTIGSLVKMSDGEGELTFDAEDENGNRISKNDEGFYTLGDAKKAFVEAYNKEKKKEFDREAKAKAKQKAKQAEKAAEKAAKATAKETPAKVEAVVEDLLDVDVSQKDGLDKVFGFLDSLDNNIKKELKKGLNDATFAIPLGIVQQIVKGLKVLVKGGMTLRDAIRSMSKETDVPQETIKDIIAISPIQEEFNALMAKVDTLIARQKSKNVAESKIISNVDTFIRNSDVYKAADDAQKKILEREGRVKMDARERRAPSIGRVLGVLKDFTNITREEKIQIIKQIRILSQNAAKSLSKEINELASSGSITPKQVAAIINRFGKVNLLNEISVANFVDYMAKVFNDAEYAGKISVAKKQLAIAKKNIETKIGMADGLMIPLRQMLAINPNLIPDSVFDEYLALVDMFGQRRAVLTLAEKSELTKKVNNVLEAVNKEQFEADSLAFAMKESKYIVYNEDGTIDFAETLKQMVKNGEIMQEDADLMRKYKSEILSQVEPETKSDKEIEAEKQDLLNGLSKTQVETSGLPSRDERNLANRLAKLIRTDAVKSLTNAELKNLLRVIDNINNNFLPNFASLMVGKLNGINNSKPLANSITKAIPLAVSKFASSVKSIFTKENPAFEMIKRGPQMSIDEMLGDFKSNNVFKSLFEYVSEASSTYKTEIRKIQNILEEAENNIAKSFLRNQETITMSKYKIMTYLIQLEYESNPDNAQVNPAADYIKKTIKLIEEEGSRYNKGDIKKFEKILKDYEDGKAGIDNKNLYDSFNPAEKAAIKAIRGINESLAQKAAFTASVIRGDKFNPLTNYVHLNVLSDTGLDESFTPDYMASFNDSMRPSTKAKSLIERTKGAKALNFDAFASAQRGANFVLMDYNLTPAVREARITLNQTKANLQQQANEKAREQAKKEGVTDENKLNKIEGKIPEKEIRIFNAIRDAFELATSDLIQASSLSNSLIDDGVDYITKQGYRTTLAGTGRFAAELLSNLWSVSNIDPVAYYDGVADFGRFSMSEDASTFMMNVKSKSTSRLYGANPLSGRIVDTNILNQASGMKGAKSIGAIENRILQAWNLSGKKVVNGIELTADALVATPDKVVSIPFWFGSFAKQFKKITGEDIDRQKVVEDNEEYMNKYADAISEAKNFADNRATTIASTDNPYMNILKGKSKKEQSALIKAFNVFNSFLTNFNIVDFYNLRRGVYSLMGKGMLTKTEGARLVSAIAGRSIIYLTLGKLFGDGILGMIGGDDEEKKEDNTWYQILGQAIASTATSAFIGRDFGNAVRLFLNSAIEYGNEKYLDFLRTGEYDRFKDSIQFSAIPKQKGNLPLGLIDFALPFAGPLQPALKTTDFVIKTWSAPDKKEEAAKERQEKNKYIRTPLEIAGNLGAVLMYKDVRKLVMKDINKSLIQEQKAAADKKANELRLLQGFKNQEDMKRYEPELWDRTYGPSSEGFDARQEVKRLKREQDKFEQAIEDEERGYTPPASKRRSSSSVFGPQKEGSKSVFGPQNKKSKSSFGPQD